MINPYYQNKKIISKIIQPLGLLVIALLLVETLHAQTDSIAGKKQMGFFDLNIGVDFRGASQWNTTNYNLYKTYASLITGRMQSSFIDNYLANNENKKFRFGDVLAAEISGGLLYKENKSSSLNATYRFEFGFGCIQKIDLNNDIGLTLTLLKFARDNVSPNFAGSNILVRYRCFRVMAEAGIEARRERILGWTDMWKKNTFPVQYICTIRYLHDERKNFGLRIEYLFNKNYQDDRVLNMHTVFSAKLFYGIYF